MGTFQCRFSIGLRADDAPILHEIRARTGVGILVHSGRNSIQQEQWRLEVNRKADGVRLVEIFDDFPLRAKKARDFAIWREAVSVWSSVVNGRCASRGAQIQGGGVCRGAGLRSRASSRRSGISSRT
jgi:hypothetical protein